MLNISHLDYFLKHC